MGGPFQFQESADGVAIKQVEFLAGAGKDLGAALTGEFPANGAAGQTTVAGHEDFGVRF
jgi:hypothetical protein